MPNMWSRRIRAVPNKDRKLSAIRLLPRRKNTGPGETVSIKKRIELELPCNSSDLRYFCDEIDDAMPGMQINAVSKVKQKDGPARASEPIIILVAEYEMPERTAHPGTPTPKVRPPIIVTDTDYEDEGMTADEMNEQIETDLFRSR